LRRVDRAPSLLIALDCGAFLAALSGAIEPETRRKMA
jgi:hypothetical protein